MDSTAIDSGTTTERSEVVPEAGRLADGGFAHED
jgi:hypothetical protein